MSHLKLSKNMLLGQCFLKNQTKIATHLDLWKYGQILTIQKSLAIKQLRFSKKDSSYEFIILYYNICWVLITNLECESISFF
jgi:hypothetical protein